MSTAAEIVGSLVYGYANSRCINVVAALGVPDAIGDEPRSADEIAGALGYDTAALFRVMRHLVSLGIFELEDGKFRHNEASRLLTSDHPDSFLPMAEVLALPLLWDSFGDLDYSIKTGRPGTERRHPEGFFGYLASHADESRAYDAGMTAMMVGQLPEIVSHYDFSPFAVIADIGGGRGQLLDAVLAQTPTSKGILFDQPHVLNQLEPADRISLHPGSFFADALPAADCYVLMRILHDWDDDEAIAIIRAIGAAARPGSRLLVIEWIVPDDGAAFRASGVDLFMLALVTGRERTLKEYERLLAAGGFDLLRVIKTGEQSIIEGELVPASTRD